MEHKNYTTVSYDQSAVNCTLSMPDDLRVSISGRDHYEVSMADGVNLKVTENREATNFDRRDILRSTYSIPYDWLFPFGRNGNGIRENTHDLPLIEDVEALPRLLRIRILRGFKQPGRNAITDIQQALGNYWMSLVRSTFQSHMDREENSEKEEATKTVYDRMEDELQPLSLGIKKAIDVETYKIGLEKEWKTAKPKTQGMAFERFLGHQTMEKEVLNWYKHCMREKYILPYFENISGTCFLWIMDCMTIALKVSVSDKWDGKIGESQKF
ncbi:uncharacterized protein LOC113464333 [Ceratina calcarata]|uniref:Uncharacterized protein LOC113464333 n=1 Tax=Ceratina calcarata TaxID=156304 RepID=A0AAJ7S0S9_9HYME|nr:uncharacterized protein LOC113464333 [Ceratina calcarata]